MRPAVTTIRLRKNGPYVIESEDVRVIDWDGAEYLANTVVLAEPVESGRD